MFLKHDGGNVKLQIREMLTGGAIAGITIVCIIAFALICFGVYYVIRKRQRDNAYLDRCTRLWTKHGKGESYMAKFPYADTSYVRAPVAGQQFTARELRGSQEFVVPQGRGKYDQGNKELADMEGKSLMSMYAPIDPGSINPNLYNSDAEDNKEMTSSNSDVKQPPQVFFSLEFNEQFNILKVYVDQVRFLKPKLFASTCDPYVTLSLLPGRVEKKSMVIRRSVDPIFQESFSFEVSKEDLQNKSLQIKFFNYDQFSRDQCTGVVLQKLGEVNLASKVDLWKKIQPISTPQQKNGPSAGDILIRLGYLPSAEKLAVVLLKARGLPQVGSEDDKKPPDPYIRVAIYHEGNLLKKKKTSTKKKTSSPTYNQAINFTVPLDVLPQLEIHFHVVHDLGVKINRAERKESIGSLEIGPTSSGEEFDHWRDLMSNKPQARWHQLNVPMETDSQQ